MFGQGVNFNIGGRKYIGTSIGGLIGLLLIVTIFFATWFLGKDIFLKEQPSLLIQDFYSTPRPQLNLNKYTFPLSFVMQEVPSNAVYYNSRYFNFSIELKEVDNGMSTMKTTYLETEPCNQAHFPTFTNDTLNRAGIFNYLCIKNQNIDLYGYWDEPKMKFLMIRLLYCQNSSSCAPKDEIENFLKSAKWTWNIYCQNSLVETTNYDQPIQYYMSNIYRYTQVGASKIHEVFLKSLQSTTDVGIIFEENNLKSSIAFDYEKFDSTNALSDGSLYDFFIFASDKTSIYKRKYLKAQTLFANLGGIIKFLFLIGNLIMFSFNNHKFYWYAIKSNYDCLSDNCIKETYQSYKTKLVLNINESQSKNNNKNNSNNCNNSDEKNNINYRLTYLPNNNFLNPKLKKQHVQLKHFNKKRFKNMNYSSWDVLRHYFCSNKIILKKKIYIKFKSLIDKELDIFNMLNKFNKIQDNKNTSGTKIIRGIKKFNS
jgi:hypothetical protein